MEAFDCTHVVLHVRDLQQTHDFYHGLLGCSVRVFTNRILGIDLGRMFINFYPRKQDLSQVSVNHIGLELPTRASVNTWFSYLQQQGTDIYASAAQTTSKTQIVLESLDDLKANQGYGPYRFYIYDPDGFRLELHTWEGVED